MAEGTLTAGQVATVTLSQRVYDVTVTADGGDIWVTSDGSTPGFGKPAARRVGDGDTEIIPVDAPANPTVIKLYSSAAADYTVTEGRAPDAGGGTIPIVAAAVEVTPAGGIAATDVQAALEELDTDKEAAGATAAHSADTTGVHGIDDTSQLATAADITAAINALVDSAPGALDTLNELAAALGDDANFAATVTTALAAKADALVTANRQTGSYTLVLGDAGKVVEMNVAGANNLTVPPNSSVAFPVGSIIEVFQYGAGQTTVVAGSGVTIRSSGGKLKLTGQYSGASLRKIATDEWALVGDIAT